MRCPDCEQVELHHITETTGDGKITGLWYECPNCGAKFDSEDAVQGARDDKEQELAAKHADEGPDPEYEPDMDRDYYNPGDF